MGKFKVGDIVKFKSKEELMKTNLFASLGPKCKALAGKVVRIYKTLEYKYIDNISYAYIIKDGQEVLDLYFQGYYFEELNPNFNFLVEA